MEEIFKIMEEMNNVAELLESVKQKTNKMSISAFGSFYCMLMEEWCKENGEDIMLIMPQILSIVVQVNNEEGKYE